MSLLSTFIPVPGIDCAQCVTGSDYYERIKIAALPPAKRQLSFNLFYCIIKTELMLQEAITIRIRYRFVLPLNMHGGVNELLMQILVPCKLLVYNIR